MKKLMFMLGAVALAACVQAASFQWTTGSAAYGIAASELNSLVNGKEYSAATSGTANRMKGETSVAWAFTLVLTDSTDPSDIKTATLTGAPVFGSTGKINMVDANALSSDLVVAGTPLTYSIVFTGTYKDSNDVTWTLTSNEISGSWKVNDQGDIALNTATPTKWTATSDVPEPTSGLLMLVGLGALALRRRRS